MKISLTELVENRKDKVLLQLSIPKDKVSLGNDVIIKEPINFEGQVYNSDGTLIIEGKIECVAEFICYRCLGNFQQKIVGELNESLINWDSSQQDIDEPFIIKDNRIDILRIIEHTLILSLPMKIICNENCKGLCKSCGVNLNTSKCHCKEDDIDPRLAKLKDLL